MNKVKLSTLLTIKNGKNYSHLQHGDIPVYGSGGLMTYVNDYLYDRESILLPRKGTLDNIQFVNKKFWTVDTVYYTEVNPKVNAYFLYNYLKLLNLAGLDSGSTLPSMTQSSYYDIVINLPERYIQDQIAELIFSIDKKIELNNKINSELESVAKLIYDYWFVQFDFPDENGKPYKSSGGKMVWNETLKKEIPATWIVGGFGDIGEIVGGSTPSRSNNEYFTQDGIPWITPKDLSLNFGNKFISYGEIDITKLGLNSASLRRLPKGTILLSSRAPIGYIAITRNVVTTNQGFKSLIPKDSFTSEFIFHTVQKYINSMIQYASGSTFSEISASTLKMIKIPIPNIDLVKSYTEKVQGIFARQDILEQENEQLARLRDWLLPMLMNGQVKIKEVK